MSNQAAECRNIVTVTELSSKSNILSDDAVKQYFWCSVVPKDSTNRKEEEECAIYVDVSITLKQCGGRETCKCMLYVFDNHFINF